MKNEDIKHIAIECGIRIDNVLNHVEPEQLQAFATALLASEQEPVAYMLGDDDFADARCYEPVEGDIPLFTHPQQADYERLKADSKLLDDLQTLADRDGHGELVRLSLISLVDEALKGE